MTRKWLADSDSDAFKGFFRWLFLWPVCLWRGHNWYSDKQFPGARRRACQRCTWVLWERP